MRWVLAVLLTCATAICAFAQTWTERELDLIRSLAIDRLAAVPASPSNRFADDPSAAELGRQLFFDARFSRDGSVSCATCHDPQRQFQDSLPLAQGIGTANRRTMPIIGAAYSQFLFWDGRVDSLWAQALQPLENAAEHGGNRTMFAHLIAELYREPYEAVFGPLPRLSHMPPQAGPVPDPAISAAWSAMIPEDRAVVTGIFVNIAKALAAYERTLLPQRTRFDAWALGEGFPAPGLLSAQGIEGLRLFVGRAACINCHNGPLFTNQTFHNTGVPSGPTPDLGRLKGLRMLVISPFNCRGRHSDADVGGCPELRFLSSEGHTTEGAFKTPGLRGVATRAPYMHAGQIQSLTDVIEHYATAPVALVGHSELRPLELSTGEKVALLAFLNTLGPEP